MAAAAAAGMHSTPPSNASPLQQPSVCSPLRTIVEGQWAVILQGLGKAVEQARVDARGGACARTQEGEAHRGMWRSPPLCLLTKGDRNSAGMQRSAENQAAGREAGRQARSADNQAGRRGSADNQAGRRGRQRRTHHARLDHVHGAAAQHGEEAGTKARGDVAVHIVLHHARPGWWYRGGRQGGRGSRAEQGGSSACQPPSVVPLSDGPHPAPQTPSSLEQRLLDLVVAGQLRGVDDGVAGNVGAQPRPQRAHALCGWCTARGAGGGQLSVVSDDAGRSCPA